MPVSDGGEGLTECIAAAVKVRWVSVRVTGPLSEPVTARYALSADGTTAYMEMAAAAGLTLVPPERRNPLLTTTRGVAEMLLDAVGRGCRRVVMGIGGSATCDGGQAMVDALRPHLPLPVEVIVASDVTSPLYGPQGAAFVFAPQKGATPAQVEQLDERLRRFARLTEQQGFASPSLAEAPGAGAAGGLGYGLMAYVGATLRSGIDLMLDVIGFDRYLQQGVTAVLTGEGCSDAQTLMGKVPMGILCRALPHGVPVHLASGAVADGARLLTAGFASVGSINTGDDRPLHVLMRPEVAKANLQRYVLNNKFDFST